MKRDALWAVTSYFNPAGYARRRANYRAFRKHLTVPLVAVELASDGRYELGADDADILVRLRDGDVMWQKERLLDVAIAHVPAACEGIAWLDCDIVFADADWAVRAHAALDRFALVHLFRERHDLDRAIDPDDPAFRASPPTSTSAIHKLAQGKASAADLFSSNAPLERRSTVGLAWASRRDVLASHGLYDACVLGSGDRAVVCAALGEFEHGARALLMGAKRRAHYLAWAQAYHRLVDGRVGAIDGHVYHLWHGALERRQYASRHRRLEDCDFDPAHDIALGVDGAWRWSSDKPALHAGVRAYFDSRREDDG
jgi:hypothetical protein